MGLCLSSTDQKAAQYAVPGDQRTSPPASGAGAPPGAEAPGQHVNSNASKAGLSAGQKLTNGAGAPPPTSAPAAPPGPLLPHASAATPGLAAAAAPASPVTPAIPTAPASAAAALPRYNSHGSDGRNGGGGGGGGGDTEDSGLFESPPPGGFAALVAGAGVAPGPSLGALGAAGLGVEATLGEMQHLALIGSGGGGCVYLGRWRGVTVGVKFIVSYTDDQLIRSQREALLSRLASHPHVVQTYATLVTQLAEPMFKPPREGSPSDAPAADRDPNISHDALAGLTSGSWIRGDAGSWGGQPGSIGAQGGPVAQNGGGGGGTIGGGGGGGGPMSLPTIPEASAAARAGGGGRLIDGGGGGTVGEGSTGSVSVTAASGSASAAVSGAGGSLAAGELYAAGLPPAPPSYDSAFATPSGSGTNVHARLLAGATAAAAAAAAGGGALNGGGAATAAAAAAAGAGSLTAAAGRSSLLGRSVAGPADSFDASFVRDHQGRHKYAIHEVLRQLGASEGQFLTMVVMEYCDGGSLLAALKEGPFHRDTTSWSPRMLLRSTVRTALEVAHGMQHLHLSGLVHGDLKPGNILLKGSNQDKRKFVAKVSDLGVAHPVGAADEMEIGDDAIGSIAFMAPEVFRGRMMKASDVYSFGVLLWQLACGTGAPPFEGAHPMAIALGVSEGRLRLRWPPGVFRPLQQLGELCTQADPTARPSFKSVVGALEKLERHMQRLAAAAAAGSGSGSGSGGPGPAAASGAAAGARASPAAAAAVAAEASRAGSWGVATALSSSSSLDPPAAGAGLGAGP
ncbi:hypothetical protein HYH03_017756 [Edaphochlamys debaryana]|uniref:Protein kinase domain-containing protein n=1 Tax=Edaphochlamys debaryana TaxID=47281 RepID=A0A836BNK4_9CHLO|nr:hypothetical protein HYH03_017756 [Edaphochlamys debaryana]|eukprot:KAG2483356.1 hypothetical protein HYH03_017756 [Edaphochlamys debaryana]